MRPLRTTGIILAGLGVAGTVIGAVGGGLAMGHADTVRSECNVATHLCSQAGLDALDDTRTLGTVSSVGFIAGGVLVAAGMMLVLIPKHERRRASAPLAPWVF